MGLKDAKEGKLLYHLTELNISFKTIINHFSGLSNFFRKGKRKEYCEIA